MNEKELYHDKHCLGCKYYGYIGGNRCCDYWSIEDKKRPCGPGAQCTVKVYGKHIRSGIKIPKAGRKGGYKPYWNSDEGYRLFCQGKSYAEVAKELGLNVQTVKSYGVRNRWTLKREEYKAELERRKNNA